MKKVVSVVFTETRKSGPITAIASVFPTVSSSPSTHRQFLPIFPHAESSQWVLITPTDRFLRLSTEESALKSGFSAPSGRGFP